MRIRICTLALAVIFILFMAGCASGPVNVDEQKVNVLEIQQEMNDMAVVYGMHEFISIENPTGNPSDITVIFDQEALDEFCAKAEELKIKMESASEVAPYFERILQGIDGTDMTPDELRTYFAVTVVDSYLPAPYFDTVYYMGYTYRCWAYRHSPVRNWGELLCNCGLRGAMDFIDDQQLMGLVFMYEISGIDIPNGPPPDDIC